MAKKLELEQELSILAIEQAIYDFKNDDDLDIDSSEMDEDEQVNREFVGEFLYNEGIPSAELKEKDCAIVRVFTQIYCEAYNDCLKILKR